MRINKRKMLLILNYVLEVYYALLATLQSRGLSASYAGETTAHKN